MILNNKVIACELEYSKCFSEYYEDDNIVRFRDNQLKDMYYHNYTYIKQASDDIELKNIIETEIGLRLSEKSNFCNILSNVDINNTFLDTLKDKCEISKNGFYSFDISNIQRLTTLSGCMIEKVENEEMINHILYSDLQFFEDTLGKDFCTRRCYRRGKVYLSEEGVDSYLCYHNGEIIGNCDLFVFEDTAKIEDFSVLPKYQRKGYGTTILKYLIDVSLKKNCKTIYLVTDEDDSAKEMYLKLGFNKIGERTDLIFKPF